MPSGKHPEQYNYVPALAPSQISKAGTRKLPTELVYHIIRLATSSDHKTAHACALVSRAVCTWTAPDRWKTIICTNLRQLDALWRLLEKDPRTHLPTTEQGVKPFTSLPSRHPGKFVENLFIDVQGTSHGLKQARDGQYLEDLFAQDLERKHEAMFGCPHLNSHNELISACGYRPHSINDILRHFQHVNYLALGSIELDSFLIHAVAPTKLLMTSNSESKLSRHLEEVFGYDAGDSVGTPAFWRADGKGWWRPSAGDFRRRLTSLHIVAIDPQSALAGVPLPVRDLESLRSGSIDCLSFLHKLAEPDRKNRGPPRRLDPYEQEQARLSSYVIWPEDDDNGHYRYVRGSDPPTPSKTDAGKESGSVFCGDPSPFNNIYGNITPTFWTEFGQGLTKIRYDTRKFAFRPCEILASRLRPFFEELTTISNNAKTIIADSLNMKNTGGSGFTHSGPRHAAPPRGAGNPSLHNQHHNVPGAANTPKRHVLAAMGCQKFRRLHLCWDPLPESSAAMLHTDNMATDRARSNQDVQPSPNRIASSDWPVERQDIWTNTSPQNNEARAPASHAAKDILKGGSVLRSSASVAAGPRRVEDGTKKRPSRESWVIPSDIESSQSKSFRVDLVDAIRGTIGWTRQEQQLLRNSSWLRATFDVEQRFVSEMTDDRGYDRFDRLVSEMAYQYSNTVTKPSPFGDADPDVLNRQSGSDEKLAIELVPPAERLRLGGMYVPYTKEQRVRWFLDNLDTDDA